MSRKVYQSVKLAMPVSVCVDGEQMMEVGEGPARGLSSKDQSALPRDSFVEEAVMATSQLARRLDWIWVLWGRSYRQQPSSSMASSDGVHVDRRLGYNKALVESRSSFLPSASLSCHRQWEVRA